MTRHNLQPVQDTHKLTTHCVACGKKIRLSEAFADLADKPFTYYCAACAQDLDPTLKGANR